MLAAPREEGGGAVHVDAGPTAQGTAVGARSHAPAGHACQVLVAAPLEAAQAVGGAIQQRLDLHNTMRAPQNPSKRHHHLTWPN